MFWQTEDHGEQGFMLYFPHGGRFQEGKKFHNKNFSEVRITLILQ
jgi:hypothetical protein